jgi:hypothetical protein
VPRTREQFTISRADSDLIRQQIEARRKGVAGLDEEIAEYEGNPDGMFIHMKTFHDVKGKVLAKRARKRRAAIVEEIDALTDELDRRASETPTRPTPGA